MADSVATWKLFERVLRAQVGSYRPVGVDAASCHGRLILVSEPACASETIYEEGSIEGSMGIGLYELLPPKEERYKKTMRHTQKKEAPTLYSIGTLNCKQL